MLPEDTHKVMYMKTAYTVTFDSEQHTHTSEWQQHIIMKYSTKRTHNYLDKKHADDIPSAL